MSNAQHPSSATTPSGLKRVVAAAMAGTVAEWYEFFLYGTASALVFGQLFFRQTDSPIDGIIAAFALYAVGFLARPLGGLVFGHYGDKYGRKRLLQLSLVVVGITTFLMGCLPGFNQIGYAAPVLLVLLRLIQGFAFGGQFNRDKWLDWSEMFGLAPHIHVLPGFYDPQRFSEGRPLRYHLGKVLKVHLSRIGLGREKWKRMTLPSFRVDAAGARLAGQLRQLAQSPGMLSSETVLAERVDRLYERIDQLRAEPVVLGLAAVAPVDLVGLAQGGHFGHPGDQAGVLDVGRGLDVQALHDGCVHRGASFN